MAFLRRLDRRDRRRSVSHFCEHGNDLVVIEFGHRVPIRTVSLSKTGFGKFSGFLRQLLLLVLEWLPPKWFFDLQKSSVTHTRIIEQPTLLTESKINCP